ncbi:hypothetical protein GGP86_000505 [Salinibacter ruber]|nr:hypothetical protein [Salinibacter ruber]
MPAHFFVNACPTFHLCSSSFPGPPAVEGPSAERTASLAVERIGPVPQTWIGDRPTDAQWHKQHFLCCPPVRVWSFSLWVGLGHTDGLDNRAARTNRTPFGTPVDDDTEASTSRARRGVGSASDQPSSTIGTVYDRLGRPARRTCDPWVRYRIAAYRYTLYHTDDIIRKATRFPSRLRIEAPGFAPAQPEPLDAPLLPFARRQTAFPLYILWFRLPAPASSPEVTKLEERLEKPPPPLFGVRRGPFCHAPLRS